MSLLGWGHVLFLLLFVHVTFLSEEGPCDPQNIGDLRMLLHLFWAVCTVHLHALNIDAGDAEFYSGAQELRELNCRPLSGGATAE